MCEDGDEASTRGNGGVEVVFGTQPWLRWTTWTCSCEDCRSRREKNLTELGPEVYLS